MADQPVGTAFVEVRPDLTGFEAELSAALKRAVSGIVPPTAGLTKAAGGQAALGAATRGTTKALSDQAKVMQLNSTELARFSRGVAATTLSTFGLRGATLAATSSFLAGAAAITALAKAVGLATSFNSQLAVFAATTGATAAQMHDVSEAAKALGRDLTLPGVTAGDAAVAMTELAKAGLSVKDSIAGAKGVLQLAGAANIDFAQAVEIAASAINAFGLAGRDAQKVADVLANAANSAQGSIVDVGIAFQQAAAIGHQVGLSFQDTTLFITELAKAGLTGSDAGTSLRTALIRLINPTKKAQEVFKRLGIEVRDAQGNLRPDFFTNLGIALQGMSAKQRDATLAIIGGQDAIRALSILSRNSIKDLIQQRDALDKNGTAAAVNAARTSGLAKASANLQNTIESLALNVGQKATPALISATNALTDFITAVAQSPAIGVLGELIHSTANAVGDLADAFRTVAPGIQAVVSGLSGVAHVIGPAAILSGVAAYLAMGKVITKVVPAITALISRLIAARAAQIAYNTAAATFGVETAGLGATLLGAINPLTALTIGVAAATAGLVFLITRESESEKAAKRLKTATEELSAAFRDQASAAQAAADAQSAVTTDKLAVSSAKLAVVEARRAVAQAKAKGDTFAIEQANNGLAVALDQVRLAQRRVNDDLKALSDASKDAAVAEQNRIDKANEEAESLRKVSEAARKAQAFRLGGDNAASEAAANKQITLAIDDRIAALQKLPGAENRALVARLNAIKQLVGKTKDFDLTAQLVLRAPDLDTGLKRVEDNLRNTGQEAGAAFVDGLRLKLNPGAIGQVLGDLPGVFAKIGKDSGESFATNLIAFVNSAVEQVTGLIFRGALRLTTVLANQTATLLQNVQRADLTGASLEQQLALAKEARARAERQLEAADAAVKAGHGRSQAAKKAQADAIQALSSAQGDVDRIQGEIDAKAKDAADKRKKAADDLKKRRDDADEAFLNALGLGQAGFEFRISKADLTAGLQDNIDAQLDLQAFLRAEIVDAANTIHDVDKRIQTINQLRQALLQSRIATKQLQEEQKQRIKQAIIDKRDRQEQSLELDVQIAETQKNKAKELRAHQRLLAFLIARQKHTDQGTLAWKQLQLKIEQERAAIKDLKKSEDDRNNALGDLEFSFLQTQAGFAAKLLGNLLPTGITAGTVGGNFGDQPHQPGILGNGVVTPAGGLPAGIGGTKPGQQIDMKISKDTQTAVTPGPSHGQLATLITIGRAQLAVLQGRKGDLGHPEAKVQKAASSAAMDTLPF